MAGTSTILTELRTKLGTWRRRTIVIGLAAIALVVLLIWSMRPEPVPADFAAVVRGELVVTIDDEGETRIENVYVVSAPVAGRVERIELNVGDEVIADETILARFQPQDPALLDVRSLSEAEAGVGLAEAEQARARAELDFARRELQRAEQLAKEGTISVVTLDRARLTMRTAQATLSQAATAVAKRRADLQTARGAMATAGNTNGVATTITYVPVRAPVSGRVLKRMQESAAILAAGTPLLEIGNPSQLEIVTDLLSTDAVKVKEGNEVIIDDWGGAPLKGIVRRVEPFGFTKVSALGVEEQRVNVIIGFASPAHEWKALGHGYRVITRIVTQRESNTLKIPVGALFRSGAEWAVFVNDGDSDGGTAELKPVKVGARNTLEAQVLDGVRENELVVVHPSDQVTDGAKLEARR